MADTPEPSPPAPPELFMTELHVSDWPSVVSWYHEVFGLRLKLRDEAGRFALLEAGPARLAIKGGAANPVTSNGSVRLVFRVADVDAEAARLRGLGCSVSEPTDHPLEPYREARLRDPEGTSITLFCWRRAGTA